MQKIAEQYRRLRSMDSALTTLEDFLQLFPEIELAQLVEVLLVDQVLQWQSGPGPSVEQYLQRFPAVAVDQLAVLELVYGEVRAVRSLGLPLDVDAYVARFPDLAEPLRRQLEVSAWLADEGESTNPEG